MNRDQLIATRKLLVAQLEESDLLWFEVPLVGNATIWVCSPVNKGGYFLPMTAAETWSLARQFDVFPLTRAVMDQAHNFCVQNKMTFKNPAMDPSTEIFDYEKYADKLAATYGAFHKTNLVSGAHKLWVLSSKANSSQPKAINYGFHYQGEARYGAAGKYLQRGFAVIQALGGRHNASHWDYSQMLQFMSHLTVDGAATDLKQAILAGHESIWDEATLLAEGDLP